MGLEFARSEVPLSIYAFVLRSRVLISKFRYIVFHVIATIIFSQRLQCKIKYSVTLVEFSIFYAYFYRHLHYGPWLLKPSKFRRSSHLNLPPSWAHMPKKATTTARTTTKRSLNLIFSESNKRPGNIVEMACQQILHRFDGF